MQELSKIPEITPHSRSFNVVRKINKCKKVILFVRNKASNKIQKQNKKAFGKRKKKAISYCMNFPLSRKMKSNGFCHSICHLSNITMALHKFLFAFLTNARLP
jgi:hypothetical protein